ncbi:unnamed protein product [Discula destructiva]
MLSYTSIVRSPQIDEPPGNRHIDLHHGADDPEDHETRMLHNLASFQAGRRYSATLMQYYESIGSHRTTNSQSVKRPRFFTFGRPINCGDSAIVSGESCLPSPLAPVFVPRGFSRATADAPGATTQRRPIVTGGQRIFPPGDTPLKPVTTSDPTSSLPSALAPVFIPRRANREVVEAAVRQLQGYLHHAPTPVRLSRLEVQLQEDELASRAARVKGVQKPAATMEIEEASPVAAGSRPPASQPASSVGSVGSWTDDEAFIPNFMRQAPVPPMETEYFMSS